MPFFCPQSFSPRRLSICLWIYPTAASLLEMPSTVGTAVISSAGIIVFSSAREICMKRPVTSMNASTASPIL